MAKIKDDFLSIDRSLSIWFGLLISVLMLIFFVITIFYYSSIIKKEQDRLSSVIANTLADSINRVAFSGKYQVRLLIEDLSKKNENIDSIMIQDFDGLIIAHTDSSRNGKLERDDFFHKAIKIKENQNYIIQDISLHRDRKSIKLIEIDIPFRQGFNGEINGVIRLFLSSSLISATLNDSIKYFVLLIALFTLISIFSIYKISQRVGRPIKNLAHQLNGILKYTPLTIYVKNREGDILSSSAVYNNLKESLEKIETIEEQKEGELFYSAKSISYDYTLNINGKDYYFSATKYPIALENDGKISLTCTIATDITEQIELLHGIESERNFFRAVVENINAIVAVIDRDGRMIRFNRYAEEFSGYSQAEISQTPYFWTVLLPNDKQSNLRVNAQKWNIIRRFENVWVSKNGEERVFDWSNGIILNEFNKMEYIVTVGVDLSRQKNIQKELEEAKNLAESANSAKSDFLANMSHEIRTPLNAVIGMSYILSQTELDNSQREYIKKINSSAKLLLGILNDILDFSKIEAGKMEIEHHNFSLKDAVNEIADQLVTLAKTKDIEVLIQIKPDCVDLVNGDKIRVQQILLNIINNAIKFTNHGHVIVRVKDKILDNGKVNLKFEVEDSGIGISQEAIDKLFAPFTQADNSTTRKFGGTGLGLSICRKLVNMMGGDIWVKSSQNIGSLFGFNITLDVVKIDKFNKQQFPNDLKILIVDDSPHSCEILHNILEGVSSKIEIFTNPIEAYHRFLEAENSSEPFALIIVDWKMPELNGVEFVKKIEQHSNKKPTILMVSAYSQELLLNETKDVGIDTIITKPFTPSIIFDSISNLLNPNKTLDSDTESVPNLANIKILLVEDNDINQEVAHHILSNTKANIEIANNGLEALNKVKIGDYDIIIMDIQMPIMDGYTSTKEILKLNLKKVPTIIAMSANATSNDIKKSKDVGMYEHLTKPIEPTKLYNVLAKITNTKKFIKVDIDKGSLEVDIDEVGALNRWNGNSRYYEVVNSFIDNTVITLKDLCKDSELSIKAHTIKGSSANLGLNLGLNLVSKFAHLIELNIDNLDECKKLILELEKALFSAKEFFKNRVVKKDEVNTIPKDELLEKLNSVIIKLKDREFNALPEFRYIKESLKQHFDMKLIDEISTNIDKFEFQKAIELIDKLY